VSLFADCTNKKIGRSNSLLQTTKDSWADCIIPNTGFFRRLNSECNMATHEGGMFFTSASQLDTKSDHQSRPRLTTGYSYGLGFTRRFLSEYRIKLVKKPRLRKSRPWFPSKNIILLEAISLGWRRLLPTWCAGWGHAPAWGWCRGWSSPTGRGLHHAQANNDSWT